MGAFLGLPVERLASPTLQEMRNADANVELATAGNRTARRKAARGIAGLNGVRAEAILQQGLHHLVERPRGAAA